MCLGGQGALDLERPAQEVGCELQADNLLAAVGKRLGQLHGARKHIRLPASALCRFVDLARAASCSELSAPHIPRCRASHEAQSTGMPARVNVFAHDGTAIVFPSPPSNARSVAVRSGAYFILRPRPMDLASFERVAE